MSTHGRKIPPQAPVTAASTPLITEAEAARRLGMSIHFLRDDRRGKRVIPFVRLGTKAIRYRPADVERAIDAMVIGGLTSKKALATSADSA